MGSLFPRRLLRLIATPPPRLESCAALFHTRPMLFKSSSTLSRKQDTRSPRAAFPLLRKVGVAGCRRPVMISSASWVACFSFPCAR